MNLKDVREIYGQVEKIRRPNRERSDFMSAYLERKGEIHAALERALEFPESLIVDELPPETTVPASIETRVINLQSWLEEQNFREIPAEVQAQLAELEAMMRQIPA